MRKRSSFPFFSPGFTLVEMVAVAAIAAILLSLVYSSGGKAREVRIGDRAMMDITTIFNAEKSHKLSTGAYLMASDTAAINLGLGLSIDQSSFSFSVSPLPVGFKITAVRLDGALCKGKSISLSSISGNFTKDCPTWGVN